MTRSECYLRSLKTQAGFTLLEILLVVLIVAIMSVAGANLINSQSIERVVINQAHQFEANLTFMCEKSILENQAYGIEWLANGYQVLRHQSPQWVVVDTQQETNLQDGLVAEVLLDGLPQLMAEEAENLPHIVCQSDGSFNAFEVRFSATPSTAPANSETYYALSSTSPWELAGAWHEN